MLDSSAGQNPHGEALLNHLRINTHSVLFQLVDIMLAQNCRRQKTGASSDLFDIILMIEDNVGRRGDRHAGERIRARWVGKAA